MCAVLCASSVLGQTLAPPAANGFYVRAEKEWLPLTAYAEFHAATETLRLVSDPANRDRLLAQVGVAPDSPGYGFLVVGSDGFPTRYYPVRVRRRSQGGTLTAAASSPAVFEWPGSCPTECCGYGTAWTAKEATPVVGAARVPGAAPTVAAPAFTIPAGGVVRAITGTLYTVETGTARVDEDFSTDATFTDFSTRHKQPVTFLAGETIELLAPRGNGVYRIVHDDRVIDANLYRLGTAESCQPANPRCAGVITKAPVTEWWVMVLNEEKQSGWINDASRFTRGACK